jgi:hypothetical protein
MCSKIGRTIAFAISYYSEHYSINFL